MVALTVIVLLMQILQTAFLIYALKALEKTQEQGEDPLEKTSADKKKERLEKQWEEMMTYGGELYGKSNGRNDDE